MTAQSYVVTLGGYPLTTTQILLQSFNNGSFPATVYSRSKRGGYQGSKLITPTFASYQFVLTFKIIGLDFDDLSIQRDKFLGILGRIHSHGVQTLQVLRPNGVTLQLDIKAVEVTGNLIVDDGCSSLVQVTLEGEYPFLQNAIPTMQDAQLSQGGGMAVPMAVPMNMASGQVSNVSITNNGNFAAYPIFTFIGPLHHPSITNQTIGLTLSLAYDLASSSDSIVVDTYLRTVVIKPSGNVGRQYASGTFWTVPIGTSVINLGTTSGGDTGKCTTFFRDHYLGI